jgi:hypothetical protein
MKEEEHQLTAKQMVWETLDNFSCFAKVIVPFASIVESNNNKVNFFDE